MLRAGIVKGGIEFENYRKNYSIHGSALNDCGIRSRKDIQLSL